MICDEGAQGKLTGCKHPEPQLGQERMLWARLPRNKGER